MEKLKSQFENYYGSSFFIDCVVEAFRKSGIKEKQMQWFVTNHFRQYEDCDIIMMKKCAAHWNNVAFDKLNQYDFLNYKMCLNTVANYRMIVKLMELENQ
jgi:hypothetical protein